jgi:hypothetical protein
LISTRNARHIRRGIMLARRGADGSDVGTLETLQKLNRAGLRAWGRARFPRLRLKVRRKRGWFWW